MHYPFNKLYREILSIRIFFRINVLPILFIRKNLLLLKATEFIVPQLKQLTVTSIVSDYTRNQSVVLYEGYLLCW